MTNPGSLYWYLTQQQTIANNMRDQDRPSGYTDNEQARVRYQDDAIPEEAPRYARSKEQARKDRIIFAIFIICIYAIVIGGTGYAIYWSLSGHGPH